MSSPLQDDLLSEASDALEFPTPSFEDLLLDSSPTQAINNPSSDAKENMELSHPFQGTRALEDSDVEDTLHYRKLMGYTASTQVADSPSSNAELKVISGAASDAEDEMLTETLKRAPSQTSSENHSSSVLQRTGQSVNSRKRVNHKCHTCGSEFPTSVLLQSHDCNWEVDDVDNLMAPNKRSRMQTSEDEFFFRNEPEADNNTDDEQPSRTRPATCRQPPRQSRNRIRRRNRQRRRLRKCNICSINFVKQAHLNLHLRLTHNAAEYTCGYCPIKFVDKVDRAHHELVHLAVNAWKKEGRVHPESQNSRNEIMEWISNLQE